MECNKCAKKYACKKSEHFENYHLKVCTDFESKITRYLKLMACIVLGGLVGCYIAAGLWTLTDIAFNHGTVYGIASVVMDVVVAIVIGWLVVI